MLLLPEQPKGEAGTRVPRGGKQGWWELLDEKPLCPPPDVTLVLVPFDLFPFFFLFLLLLSCVLLIPSIGYNCPGDPT